MNKLTQDDATSHDIVADNIDKLKAIFPEAFTEGKVDFDVLKETLGEYRETQEERYNFSWAGKSKARRLAQTPTTGTLRPCPEESVDWDKTENLFIEGDNLEVLKLLQKSYQGQVKMIFIDPPYNTGSDFVYPDKYADNLKGYLRYTGQIDDAGNKLSDVKEAAGRLHSNWLNMMLPRLNLARNLLSDNGVIFISIDDGEAANLKKLCDEIFGEENFIAQITWEKMYTTKNDSSLISQCHDYVLTYVKNLSEDNIYLLPRTAEMDARYTNPDNDPRGPWKPIPLYAKGERKNGRYPVVSPKTKKEHLPQPESHWLYAEEDTNKLIADDRIYFGKDGNAQPNVKRFLSEVQQGTKAKTIWKHSEVGSNDSAKRDLRKTYNEHQIPFDFPKPATLIDQMLTIATKNSGKELIVDFFAGSGTTGDAVIRKNALDGGARNYIMVQIPELIDEEKQEQKIAANYCKNNGLPLKITELSKDRMRKAGKRVEKEHPDYGGDLGFKVFKLDSSNIEAWDSNVENLEDNVLKAANILKDDRSELDIVYELFLKYGLDLSYPVNTHQVAGKQVYEVGAGSLFICLEGDITTDFVEGLIELCQQFRDESEKKNSMRIVFKDSGFKTDAAKKDAESTLKDAGILDVKCL